MIFDVMVIAKEESHVPALKLLRYVLIIAQFQRRVSLLESQIPVSEFEWLSWQREPKQPPIRLRMRFPLSHEMAHLFWYW